MYKVLQGDVIEKLKEIESGTVHCCLTSPPYWALRDYGCDGQLGLEETPEEYIESMVGVFREVKRVLRDDGTLWINIADSYAGSGKAGKNPELLKNHKMFGKPKSEYDASIMAKPTPVPRGLKPKDLIGIPWRLAFALQADGWWLRSDIIWQKPNPMPESVTDRPTNAHEYVFLLAKSQRYFYDAEAIKEPAVGGTDMGLLRNKTFVDGKNISAHAESIRQRQEMGIDSRTAGTGFRNKRSVWTVATQPYPNAHFACYPPKLITPMILAGSSPRTCEMCGAPWERVVERDVSRYNFKEGQMQKERNLGACSGGTGKVTLGVTDGVTHTTTGWKPTCICENKGEGKSIILDPFAGSGTTLWVAEHYGRDSIGIELNPEYCKLIHERMDNFQQTIFSAVDY